MAGEENTADKNNESSNPQSVAPLGITQPVTSEGGELNENSEATQAPPQAHQGESEKPPKKPGRIAAFLFGDNPDRTNRTIALATVIIAGSAIIQLGVAVAQYSEMYSGGKQTDDIIHAAKKIKLALITANKQNSDAVSETLTQNQGQFAATLGQMKNQVGKLQAGVDETARLAQAAVNANEISHEALEAQVRPWIGPEGDPIDVSFGNVIPNTDPPQRMIEFSLNLNNFGNTPAQKVTVNRVLSPMYRASENLVACQNADKALYSDFGGHRQLATVFPSSPKPFKITGVIPNEANAICIAYLGRSDKPYHTILVYQFRPYLEVDARAVTSGEQKFRITMVDSEIY